jgi:hypothetical protein
MAALYAPTTKLKHFFFLTKLPAIKYNVFVLFSDKEINPVDHCKTYKIWFARISEFVFSAHVENWFKSLNGASNLLLLRSAIIRAQARSASGEQRQWLPTDR